MNDRKNETLPGTIIQWLCPRCYEAKRNVPAERNSTRRKYCIWESGRYQKDGECQMCGTWTLLTQYEWYDAEQREMRNRAQAARNYGYMLRKDTRARYREREDEA